MPHFTAGSAVRSDGTARATRRRSSPSINFAVRFSSGDEGTVPAQDRRGARGRRRRDFRPQTARRWPLSASGSGKSTTARAILGLVKATRGRIGHSRPQRPAGADGIPGSLRLLQSTPRCRGIAGRLVIAAGQRLDVTLRARMVCLTAGTGGTGPGGADPLSALVLGRQRQRLWVLPVR